MCFCVDQGYRELSEIPQLLIDDFSVPMMILPLFNLDSDDIPLLPNRPSYDLIVLAFSDLKHLKIIDRKRRGDRHHRPHCTRMASELWSLLGSTVLRLVLAGAPRYIPRLYHIHHIGDIGVRCPEDGHDAQLRHSAEYLTL
jgi:hypothetical protein